MKVERLSELIGDYLVRNAAPKMASPITKAVFGAASSRPGKRFIRDAIAPYLGVVTDADGEINLDDLREMVSAGLKASGPVPLMHGLVTVDATDVDSLFEFVRSSS